MGAEGRAPLHLSLSPARLADPNWCPTRAVASAARALPPLPSPPPPPPPPPPFSLTTGQAQAWPCRLWRSRTRARHELGTQNNSRPESSNKHTIAPAIMCRVREREQEQEEEEQRGEESEISFSPSVQPWPAAAALVLQARQAIERSDQRQHDWCECAKQEHTGRTRPQPVWAQSHSLL